MHVISNKFSIIFKRKNNKNQKEKEKKKIK